MFPNWTSGASIVAHTSLTLSFSRPTQCRIALIWSAEPGTRGASGESIPGYLVVERKITDGKRKGEVHALLLGGADLVYAVGDVQPLHAAEQGQRGLHDVCPLVDQAHGYAIPDRVGRPPCYHGEPPGRALAQQGQVSRLDAAGEVVEVRGAGVAVVNALVETERGIRVDQVQAGGLVE